MIFVENGYKEKINFVLKPSFFCFGSKILSSVVVGMRFYVVMNELLLCYKQ